MNAGIRRVTTPTMPVWYAIVVLLIVVVILSGTNVFYTRYVAADTKAEISAAEEERDRNLCEVIDSSLGVEKGVVPPLPSTILPNSRNGRTYAAMVNLRNRLGCS